MKKVFFSVATLVAAMSFTACSSDIFNDEYNVNDETIWNNDGEGYVSLRISMPADATASRANDNFHNGLPQEFEVKDAYLLIFGGETNEAEAKLAGAYQLPLQEWHKYTHNGDDPDAHVNITEDQTFVQKISRMGGSKAWAMVVLNANDYFNLNGTELSIDGAVFNGTIRDLQTRVMSNLGDRYAKNFYKEGKGFLMLNAPLSVHKGGATSPAAPSVDIQTLAPIKRENIKPTENEAKEAVAANVYVERAVAKVTMHEHSTPKALTEVADMTWKLDSWALDNTNKKSYLVRNTTSEDENMGTWAAYYTGDTNKHGVNKHRFVGEANVNQDHDGATGNTDDNRYRTYFAQDPNYTGYNATDFYYKSENGALEIPDEAWKNTYGDNHPVYCAENTFNVRQQIWGATTRVIFKTILNDGETFYTTSEGTDTYYTGETVLNLALNNYLTSAVVQSFKDDIAVKELDSKDVTAKLVVDADGNTTFEITWPEGSIVYRTAEEIAKKHNEDNFGSASWINKIPDYSDEGWRNIATSNLNPAPLYTEKPDGWWTSNDSRATGAVKSSAPTYADATKNSTLTIYTYNGGVTYYEARIKHFGDDACPWGTWEANVGETVPTVTAGAYPGTQEKAEQFYLGRWGVLRNNWYDLDITNIKKIGYVNPPTLDKTSSNTDDELDQFIAVDVNVLSWAKRTQNMDL